MEYNEGIFIDIEPSPFFISLPSNILIDERVLQLFSDFLEHAFKKWPDIEMGWGKMEVESRDIYLIDKPTLER